jgi:23S rRNA (cytosine1962-C5)-methyltransferase
MQVKPAAERALRRGHPWLFNNSIRRQSHEGQVGDLAVIFDHRDRFLAVGLYDPDSPIRVRVLHHGRPATINDGWFRDRLSAAFNLRRDLFESNTTGYRLLHGENDGLPGLVIDRYHDDCAVRLDTAAWTPRLGQILPIVLELMPSERLVLRLRRRMHSSPTGLHGLSDGQTLFGPANVGPVIFQENGLAFEADLVRGQKTGFFLDQRDNRLRLEKHINQDGSLRRVLNVFAYTGAFAVYAARGGADQLTNVDASEVALAAAERNLLLNKDQWAIPSTRHEAIAGDAFAVMQMLADEGRHFDAIIVDPPSFARSSDEIGRAKGAYRRLTQLALPLLRPHGLLLLCSCSSRVDGETFFVLVKQAAKEVGRPLVELARTGHPADHPIGFPEGAYLKCMFASAP